MYDEMLMYHHAHFDSLDVVSQTKDQIFSFFVGNQFEIA